MRVVSWQKHPQRSLLINDPTARYEDLMHHCGSMVFIFNIVKKDERFRDKFKDEFGREVNTEKVIDLILVHDAEEVVVGDSRDKNNEFLQQEAAARERIANQVREQS